MAGWQADKVSNRLTNTNLLIFTTFIEFPIPNEANDNGYGYFSVM